MTEMASSSSCSQKTEDLHLALQQTLDDRNNLRSRGCSISSPDGSEHPSNPCDHSQSSGSSNQSSGSHDIEAMQSLMSKITDTFAIREQLRKMLSSAEVIPSPKEPSYSSPSSSSELQAPSDHSSEFIPDPQDIFLAEETTAEEPNDHLKGIGELSIL